MLSFKDYLSSLKEEEMDAHEIYQYTDKLKDEVVEQAKKNAKEKQSVGELYDSAIELMKDKNYLESLKKKMEDEKIPEKAQEKVLKDVLKFLEHDKMVYTKKEK